MTSQSSIVGGGTKKILYALETMRKIGPRKAQKALTSNNACKACALGMGGQNGGMTNEQGEFPAVCNKSIQAQSTDIQPPIPNDLFEYDLSHFRELSARELEKLGRLNTPLFKPKGADKFQPIGWDEAISMAADKFGQTNPDRTFFYSSGRSSNEAAFLFQLFARTYGTNNVTNCSYYCHQATSVGLGSTIGAGTATIELADLDKADFIAVIGANPSSNHPRFIHKLKHCRDRGGEVLVINPAKEPGLVKFALPKSPKSLLKGGDDIASQYLQPKIGSDIALLKGFAKAMLEAGLENTAFIETHTSNFGAYKADAESARWDDIELQTGVAKDEIVRVAHLLGKAKAPVIAWGMGITHHVNGCDNVEAIASLALLCGAIGREGAGLLPLRGHSNVQGIGTIGVKPVLADDVIERIEDAFDIKLPKKQGMDTMASMEAAARGEIDAALIMGGNLYAANPNTAWAAKALGSIGFKVALTTTLNQSHVYGSDDSDFLVLPVTARDEEWEPTTQESMFNYVRLSDGGISRFDNVKPESVILADLATALLPDSPIDFDAFKKHRFAREAIAKCVPGMEELASIDIAKREFHVGKRLIHTPTFKTATGKATFVVTKPGAKTPEGQYSLSTIRSEGQFNSIVYEEKDSYRGAESRWSVLVSEKDLKAAGLQDGDSVDIRSDHGEMRAVSVKAFDLPRGSIMAYYPEANALTGRHVDPRSKTPSFKNTAVRIERAAP